MRYAVIIVAGLLAAGCVSSDVVSSSPTGIWIKEPFVGSGDPEEIAAEHCASFGKTAVFQHKVVAADGQFRPIHVFDCR